MRFGGEGRSRQEDAETSSRPGWAQPRQRPSPFFSQPRGRLLTQVRSCSEESLLGWVGQYKQRISTIPEASGECGVWSGGVGQLERANSHLATD
jgi:hypothetical protein